MRNDSSSSPLLQEGILRFEFTLEEKAPLESRAMPRQPRPRAGCPGRSLFRWLPAYDPVGQGLAVTRLLQFGRRPCEVAPDSFASKKGIPVNYEACAPVVPLTPAVALAQVHAINGLALVQQNQQRAPSRDRQEPSLT